MNFVRVTYRRPPAGSPYLLRRTVHVPVATRETTARHMLFGFNAKADRVERDILPDEVLQRVRDAEKNLAAPLYHDGGAAQ